MIELDFAKLSVKERYKLLISAIVPRPIAWVSTRSLDGKDNLAPFSFFNGVSSDPPCISISMTYKSDGSKKDSLRNIEATGEFVVNIASEKLMSSLDLTSKEFPPEVDEAKEAHLTRLPSRQIKPSRIAEAPVHLECKLRQLVPIGDPRPGAAVLVLGEVVYAHLRDGIAVGGKIQSNQLNPLARLGGVEYATLGEILVAGPK